MIITVTYFGRHVWTGDIIISGKETQGIQIYSHGLQQGNWMVVCKLINLTVQLDHVFSLCSFFSSFKHKYEEKVQKSEFLKKIEFKNQNYVRQKTKIILNKT